MQIAASNETILTGVENYNDLDHAQKLNYDRTITAYLIDIMKFNNDIKDLIVVGKSGEVLYSSGASVIRNYNFYSKPWFPKNEMQYSKVTFIGLYEQDYYYSGSGRNVISAVIPIINFMKGNRNVLGAIICNMDIDKIVELEKDSSPSNSEVMLVVDTTGNMVNQKMKDLVDENFFRELIGEIGASRSGNNIYKYRNNDVVSVHSTSDVSGWKIICLIPIDQVVGDLNTRVRNLIFMLIAANIVFVAIQYLLISSRIDPNMAVLASS
jgi:two-component system sensor histidine kinase YesM